MLIQYVKIVAFVIWVLFALLEELAVKPVKHVFVSLKSPTGSSKTLLKHMHAHITALTVGDFTLCGFECCHVRLCVLLHVCAFCATRLLGTVFIDFSALSLFLS